MGNVNFGFILTTALRLYLHFKCLHQVALIAKEWKHYLFATTHRTRMHSSGMHIACLLTISHSTHGGGGEGGGCIPACIERGGVSQHALGRGCIFQHALGGDVCPGGGVADTPLGPEADTTPPRDQSQTHPPLWTDRHLRKHNLRKLRLRR